MKRLLILFLHLLFLSISVYLRPITENMATQEAQNGKNNDLRKKVSGTESIDTNRKHLNDGNNGIGDDDDDDDGEPETDVKNILRYCSEVATLLGVLSYVIFQQGDEIKNQGLAAFSKQLVIIIIFKHTHAFLYLRH